MGTDAEIYVKVKDLSLPLPILNFDEVGFIYMDEKNWLKEELPEATHRVFNQFRYYDIGYGSSNWPTLREILTRTMNHPNVECVWYFGDSQMAGPLFTLERLAAIDKRYLLEESS